MELKSALTDVPGKMYKNITNVVFAHNNIFFLNLSTFINRILLLILGSC